MKDKNEKLEKEIESPLTDDEMLEALEDHLLEDEEAEDLEDLDPDDPWQNEQRMRIKNASNRITGIWD